MIRPSISFSNFRFPSSRKLIGEMLLVGAGGRAKSCRNHDLGAVTNIGRHYCLQVNSITN